MALADDLKRMDFKDVANWPAAFQLTVLFLITCAVVVLGYFSVWSSQFEELEAGHLKEEELKTQFVDKKQRAVNLEAYKQQLAEIKETFEVLLKQLPRKSEMESLLTEINQSGVGRGLQFDLFKPALAENKTGEMAELPIEIKLTGNYHDLAAFASDVSKLSRIVTLNNLLLKTPAPGAGVVQMEVVAKTYRYLDEDEKSELKRAEMKGAK